MSTANLTRDEAARRALLVSVSTYDVSLDLSSARDGSVPGFATVSTLDFTLAEPGADTFLDFIGEVHAVVLNGVDLAVDDVVDGPRIHLRNLAASNRVTVSGTAWYSSSGEGMHRFVDPADGETYLYTQYEPADARRVFANFEQPDLKAEFTFHVTAPAGWQVASNGAGRLAAKSASAAGAERWDFARTRRISTYITSVLAGPYHRAEDLWTADLPAGRLEVPLAAFCRASLAPHFDAARIFEHTRKGLDFFHQLFELPYPFGKYDQAFVPEYNLGAMENPGLVTFTEKYVFESRATDAQYQRRANTLLHEMAHMWFGDLVTMKWWDDLWLKESFADFMGTLAVAESTQWKDAWVGFANQRKAWAYLQDQLPTTHPVVADIQDLEAAKQNFDGITYAKGASVLKQLVAYVGFDGFIAGARGYFRQHAYGNTTLQDLLTALEAASGRDLTGWSALWLQTAGLPTLTPVIETDGTTITSLAVHQEAPDPLGGGRNLRPHRLRIGFYDRAADGTLQRSHSLELDVDGELTEVPGAAGLPRPALLLLNDEDLTYAKVRLDDASAATALAELGALRDPMARALVWSALWNATRDAVMPAAAFVDAVDRAAAAETDIGVLQMILDQAGSAVERYAPAVQRGQLRARFLAAAVRELGNAAAGSDQQLAWARTVAAVGRRTPEANQFLRDLLAGRGTPSGLAVDADLRWQLWQALAANGGAQVPELDGELARDQTASGRARHLTAVTARPAGSVKEAAWERILHGKDLSNELLGAAIEGYRQGPAELREGFRGRYFDALESVWASRSIEIAGRIVGGLYPSDADAQPGTAAEDHPVVAITDHWLRTHPDAPAALRRILLEQRALLLVALRAQLAAV